MSALEARALQLRLEGKTRFSSCSCSSPQRSETLGASPSWARATSVPAPIAGQGNRSRCPPRLSTEQVSEGADGGHQDYYQPWKTGMF